MAIPRKPVARGQSIEVLREHGLRRLLIAAARSVNREITRELGRRGFKKTRPGHSMLLANLDVGGNSVSELAERASMSKQSMARLAVELERLKLITRRTSSTDRRTLVLTFTARGRAMVAETIAALDRLEAELRSEMGADTFATVKHGLAVIAKRP